MRPIKQQLMLNLSQQAAEADLLGLTKIASHLTSQIENFPIRSNGAFSYQSSDLEKDIDANLWSSAIDILNFHNTSNFDVVEIQNLITQSRNEFLNELRHKIGCKSPHGAYEHTLPGEKKELIDIEVVID
jgi:hypothetical protein